MAAGTAPAPGAGAVSASYAPPVQRLVSELSKLPGIGNRTAQRLAFHILRSSGEDAGALAQAIVEVKEKIGLCEVCFNLTDERRCGICADTRRDHTLICVVEEPSDVIAMERTHEYHGTYHVLGGALSPIDGVDPEDLKLQELFARVLAQEGADGAGGNGTDVGGADVGGAGAGGAGVGGAGAGGAGAAVREVVLATNPTTTGEATALYVAEELRGRAPQVQVTRLASGLPVGSDLEYADEVTLGKALAGRRAL
ncbi:MAG TPA: recombination mediator RecR [Solirubrobacteraceae bacterium]|nr:recombination mediator RecR [Solirubrobacteraceae bacterium]